MNSPREINKSLEKHRLPVDYLRLMEGASGKFEIPTEKQGVDVEHYDFDEKKLEEMVKMLEKKEENGKIGQLGIKVLLESKKLQEQIVSLRTKSRESGGMSIADERLILPGETLIDPDWPDEAELDEKISSEESELALKKFINRIDYELRSNDDYGYYEEIDRMKKTVNLAKVVEVFDDLEMCK